MRIDQRIIERLETLLKIGEEVLATVWGRKLQFADPKLANQWATSSQSFLNTTFGQGSDYYKNFTNAVSYNDFSASTVQPALGILCATADDIASGALFKVRSLIEAEVFDDFLEQAKSLLEAGYFQAAAVVCGAVLEDGLRNLCENKGISLPDKPKLDFMNSELAKKGIYNKLVQKQITAYGIMPLTVNGISLNGKI